MKIQKGTASGKKIGKRIYINTLFWFLGRSLQVAASIDPVIKEEIDTLPENYTFCLVVHPQGPSMVLSKGSDGFITYKGRIREGQTIDLRLILHDIEAAMLLLSFKESTALSAARDRMSIHGSIIHGCTVARIIDRLEILLLPSFIAKHAVKRYTSPKKLHSMRARLYVHCIAGH